MTLDAPVLELKSAMKGFPETDGGFAEVLTDINLRVSPGEILAIVGYSGSGKTTLINLLAGLLKPDGGEALAMGRPIAGPSPERSVVFQNYSLLPWLTTLQNVRLAVDEVFSSESESQKDERARKYLDMVKLTPALGKRPSELSGGMRQRVALARGLSIEPDTLLLDEPLGALDALTRGTLQQEICRICEREKRTVVLITNDVDEGILMADRIIPLTQGPKATLGPTFEVSLPRPRLRQEVHTDPEFRRIRKEINEFLLGDGRKASTTQVTKRFQLPDLLPEDLTVPRRWYQPKRRPRRRNENVAERIEVNA